RDREICDAIGPTLRRQGMIFVGIDVIGDWLTEINVTSPTGIQEIDRFDGINIEAMIWDRIEARRGAGQFVSEQARVDWLPYGRASSGTQLPDVLIAHVV